MQIRKAERKKAKLRLGIAAPSGAGKTYSALLMAFGIGGARNLLFGFFEDRDNAANP